MAGPPQPSRLRRANALLAAAAVSAMATGMLGVAWSFFEARHDVFAADLHQLAAALPAGAALGLLAGFLPALLFLWPALRLASAHSDAPPVHMAAGALAGLTWLATAWATRPSTPLWEQLLRARAELDVPLLFTGHMLLAGLAGEQALPALALVVAAGGVLGGLIHARIRHPRPA